MALTKKQKMFVEEYLIDLNAKQAAIRAGYSPKTAGETGYENLNKPHIKQEIDKRMKDREKRTEITQDKVLKELASIGFANASDFVKVEEKEYISGYEKDEEGNLDINRPIYSRGKFVNIYETDSIEKEKLAALAGIKHGANGIEIKLHDKVKALELIGKHLAMFTDKVEHSGEIKYSIIDPFKKE